MGCPQVKQIIHLPAGKGDISPELFVTLDPKTWTKGYRLEDRVSSAKDISPERSFEKLLAKSLEQPSEKHLAISVFNDSNSNKQHNKDDMELGRSEDRVDLEDYEEYKDMPPNISLNIHGGSNIVELVVCAVFASTLQIAVLVWSGFLAYSSYADRHKLTGSKRQSRVLVTVCWNCIPHIEPSPMCTHC